MRKKTDIKDRTTSLRLNKAQLIELRYKASVAGKSVGCYLLDKGLET